MKTSSKPESGTANSYTHTPTRTVDVNGSQFAYRQLGPDAGTPVIFLTHLGANLDNWDPGVVDGIATPATVAYSSITMPS